AHGLHDNEVLCVLEDDFGWLWMNSIHGIFRVRKQELIEYGDGNRQSVSCVAYGTEDGMLSAEGNGENFPNGCKDRDGRLWFPTTRGVAVVDPALLQHARKP